MTPNTFGTHNNVITVKASDFEAFEALGMDSIETKHFDDNYYIKYGTFVIISSTISNTNVKNGSGALYTVVFRSISKIST